jgi:hypothetical protein
VAKEGITEDVHRTLGWWKNGHEPKTEKAAKQAG